MNISTSPVNQKIETFLCEEVGMTTVEYAVAGALVAAALTLAFIGLGDAVAAAITDITGFITP